MKVAAIIPARYASTRFPGKPLADIGGRSMVQWVYEAVQAVPTIQRVIVATDDQRIFDHVTQFGGEAQMTRPDHPSGTDRVAEVAQALPDFDIIVNVQGDEPFVSANQLNALLAPFAQAETKISTLARLIREEADLFSPNVVKVIPDAQDRALYFSRQTIPYLRDLPLGQWLAAERHFQHLGLYAFRRSTLLELCTLPAGILEQAEKLEQLRWLAAGYPIHLGYTTERSIGIDTPADLERAREFLG